MGRWKKKIKINEIKQTSYLKRFSDPFMQSRNNNNNNHKKIDSLILCNSYTLTIATKKNQITWNMIQYTVQSIIVCLWLTTRINSLHLFQYSVFGWPKKKKKRKRKTLNWIISFENEINFFFLPISYCFGTIFTSYCTQRMHSSQFWIHWIHNKLENDANEMSVSKYDGK